MNNKKMPTTDWLIKGVSNEQLETEKALAVISAQIYIKRTETGMDQKAFAKYMGVTQGLVSRWESGTYNFSISTLISICDKLGLVFEPKIMEKEFVTQNIKFIKTKNNNYDSFGWGDWSPHNAKELKKGVA